MAARKLLLPPTRRAHTVRIAYLFAVLLLLPLAAHAQVGGSPFDSGFTAMQNLFTGTVAKVASLIAIVIGGYGFAHGEPEQRGLSPASPQARGSLFSRRTSLPGCGVYSRAHVPTSP
jgi:TrbC/VIRB2 pilin